MVNEEGKLDAMEKECREQNIVIRADVGYQALRDRTAVERML